MHPISYARFVLGIESLIVPPDLQKNIHRFKKVAGSTQQMLNPHLIPPVSPIPENNTQSTESTFTLLPVYWPQALLSPLTEENIQLIERMIKVTEWPKFEIVNQFLPGPGVGLLFALDPKLMEKLNWNSVKESEPMNDEVKQLLQTVRPGDTIVQNQRTWFVTHPLKWLIEGTSNSIQKHKRETWCHLLQIKAWKK